jgi:nucleoside-diphosphate-sugar epimerase
VKKRSYLAYKNTPVLITGAAGFVGANLTRRLLELGANVHVIVKRSTNMWRLREIKKELSLHDVPLTDEKKLTLLVRKIKPLYIFHLAARGAYSYQTDCQEMIEVNVRGTATLLAALRNIPYKGFVNTGSHSEYGFKHHPLKETDFLEPVSFYAATKAAATYLTQVFAIGEKAPAVTVRLFSVYGPWEEPTRFVPTIINRALANQPLLLTQGRERRDHVYVDDTVEAYLAAALAAAKHRGAVFNICSGRQYAIREVVATLEKIVGKLDARWGAYPARNWDTNYWVGNPSFTADTIGWRATTSLNEGLQKTMQWLQVHTKEYTK